MPKFKIKKSISGIDENTKGGTLVDGIFTTEDRPWIKHLRQFKKAHVEEMPEGE